MAQLRLTVVRPIPERREEAWEVLTAIDELFVSEPGLVMSLRFGKATPGVMGRVAIWETEGAANRLALSTHVLALRARLQELSGESVIEALTDVADAHWPWGDLTAALPLPLVS